MWNWSEKKIGRLLKCGANEEDENFMVKKVSNEKVLMRARTNRNLSVYRGKAVDMYYCMPVCLYIASPIGLI